MPEKKIRSTKVDSKEELKRRCARRKKFRKKLTRERKAAKIERVKIERKRQRHVEERRQLQLNVRVNQRMAELSNEVISTPTPHVLTKRARLERDVKCPNCVGTGLVPDRNRWFNNHLQRCPNCEDGVIKGSGLLN